MRKLEFTFTTRIEFSAPVHDHYFVLRCLPRGDGGAHVVEAAVTMDPDVLVTREHDAFDNLLTVGSILEPHDHIEYRSAGLVEMERAKAKTDRPHPLFSLSSPLATPDDRLRAFAQEFADVHAEMDARACEDLSHAVHEAMAYVPGATSVRTTAQEAFAAGRGVCQDYAHVTLALLRELGVPARYVGGLAEGEGQTHAWVEASLNDRWLGLDPTRDQLVDNGYLPLCCGRDWADCPIESGSLVGAAEQTQTSYMTVREVA